MAWWQMELNPRQRKTRLHCLTFSTKAVVEAYGGSKLLWTLGFGWRADGLSVSIQAQSFMYREGGLGTGFTTGWEVASGLGGLVQGGIRCLKGECECFFFCGKKRFIGSNWVSVQSDNSVDGLATRVSCGGAINHAAAVAFEWCSHSS